jgi:hypothetical protein
MGGKETGKSIALKSKVRGELNMYLVSQNGSLELIKYAAVWSMN